MYSTARQAVKSASSLAVPHTPLAVVFVNGDFDARGRGASALLDCCQQSLPQVFGQQFGSSVAQRQQDTVAARENPASAVGGENGFDFLVAGLDAEQWMADGQQ